MIVYIGVSEESVISFELHVCAVKSINNKDTNVGR